MEPFVARPARGRIALLAFASLLFVPLCLWVAGAFGEAPRAGREWIGWLGAVFFAFCGIAWALRLRDSAPRIVIDETGLRARQWSDEHIPWAAMRAIDERSIKRQIFFPIHLHDPAAHPPTRLLGRISAAQGGMGMGHFSLSATGTDRSAGELREALLHYWRDDDPGA